MKWHTVCRFRRPHVGDSIQTGLNQTKKTTRSIETGVQKIDRLCVYTGLPSLKCQRGTLKDLSSPHQTMFSPLDRTSTLYVAPAPPWLFPAASCSGALCCSDILLIHCSSTFWQQHTHRQSTIHYAYTHRYIHADKRKAQCHTCSL